MIKCEECEGAGWVLDEDVFDVIVVTRNAPTSLVSNYSLSDVLVGHPQPDGGILDLCIFCDGTGREEGTVFEPTLCSDDCPRHSMGE